MIRIEICSNNGADSVEPDDPGSTVESPGTSGQHAIQPHRILLSIAIPRLRRRPFDALELSQAFRHPRFSAPIAIYPRRHHGPHLLFGHRRHLKARA